VTDPVFRLRELAAPTVDPALSAAVLGRAHAILERRGPQRIRSRAEIVVGILVAALGLLHTVWAVGFLNRLYH
jgi:hypothetical protein